MRWKPGLSLRLCGLCDKLYFRVRADEYETKWTGWIGSDKRVGCGAQEEGGVGFGP